MKRLTWRKISVFAAFIGIALVMYLVGYSHGYEQPKTPTAVAQQNVVPTNVYELWVLTNAERSKAGIPSLALDDKLNASAKLKCDDMVARNYWQHNTPDGIKPWTFIDQLGVKYKAAGENLAYGFSDSNSVVAGWMNSPSHKENVLKPHLTRVGYSICNSPNFVGKGAQQIVVQHFTLPQ